MHPEALESIKAARKAVGLPRDELDLLEAQILLRRGRRGEAHVLLRKLIKRSRGAAQSCARALLHLNEGKYSQARSILRTQLKQGQAHMPSLDLYAWALFGCDAFEESFEALYTQWLRRGALNGHMLTLSSLLGLSKALEMIAKNPRSAMSIGQQAMQITTTNLTVSDGASGRFAVCDFFLRRRFPGMIKLWINNWVGARLQEAKTLEPDRAELWLLGGLLLLRSGSTANEVLEHWRRARKRDPLLKLTLWKRVFEERYGPNERLDQLLRD